MCYAAGLDGGGTKTAVQLRTAEGGFLAEAVFGPLNRNGGEAAVRRTLQDCFAWLNTQPGGLDACGAMCVGSAGISNPDAYRFLVESIRGCGYAGGLSLVGDQVTALAGALGRPVGTVLIAGTGSICYARTADGRDKRVGGWGHIIDDEGSGYALGRDILRAVVRAEDGRGPKTYLSGLVAAQLACGGIGDVIRFIYAPETGKKEIAALAPLLSEALGQGDAAALAIADAAAESLAEMAATALTALGLEDGELACLGSVLTKNDTIRDGVRQRLHASFPGLQFPAPRGNAADGAAAMAVEMLKNEGEEEHA